jgi:hypothetical protein
MDAGFMETVWWVFKQLFEKGLVYKGFKVSCSSCEGVGFQRRQLQFTWSLSLRIALFVPK